jgi:hypothetical protein
MGIRKSNREGEFDQSTLNVCIEISQGNSFVQLLYANKKVFKAALFTIIKLKGINNLYFSLGMEKQILYFHPRNFYQQKREVY